MSLQLLNWHERRRSNKVWQQCEWPPFQHFGMKGDVAVRQLTDNNKVVTVSVIIIIKIITPPRFSSSMVYFSHVNVGVDPFLDG